MSDTSFRLGVVSLQVFVFYLHLVFVIDVLQGYVLTLLLLAGCSQAQDQGYGDQSLDCCTAPSPADVVKEESSKACAKKAANGKGCRPEGRYKRVSLDVFWISWHLSSSVEGTGVRGDKNGASSEAKEHQTHRFHWYSRGNGKERGWTEEEEGKKETEQACYTDSPGLDV